MFARFMLSTVILLEKRKRKRKGNEGVARDVILRGNGDGGFEEVEGGWGGVCLLGFLCMFM